MPPPTNLQVCIDEDGNSLYWSEAPGTSTYRVYRAAFAPVPVDPEHFIGQGIGPHYRDSSSQWGHYYVVTALHAEGESKPTDTVQATQPCWMRTAEGDVIITKYYFFNGQRIAMREVGEDIEDIVDYLMGDHLGTTSVVISDNVMRKAQSRHYLSWPKTIVRPGVCWFKLNNPKALSILSDRYSNGWVFSARTGKLRPSGAHSESLLRETTGFVPFLRHKEGPLLVSEKRSLFISYLMSR